MVKSGQGPMPVGEMPDDHTWTKTVWVPQIPLELNVDEEGLSTELAVEELAINAAERQLPKTKDNTLDETQLSIGNRVFRGILMLNQFLAEQLGACLSAARGRRVRAADRDGIMAQAELAIDDRLVGARADLKRLRETQIRCETELRAFAARNRLGRGAQYKRSRDLTYATLFLLLVGESLANAWLLKSVLSGGLAEGFFIAIAISAVNLFSGLFAGVLGWRYLFHRNQQFRISGGLLLILLHTFALAFNIAIAHFREAAELLAGDENYDFQVITIGQEAVRHFTENGAFGMVSLQAWLLFFAGLIVHLIATYKGFDELYDRYPLFARYDMRAQSAADAYDQAVAEAREDAKLAVEQIEFEASTTARQAESWRDDIDDLINRAEQRVVEVADSEDDWVSVGDKLLKLYRDKNAEVRHDPAPAYFNRFPKAEEYRERRFGGVERDVGVRDQQNEIQKAMKGLADLRKEADTTAKVANENLLLIHREVSRLIRALDDRMQDDEAKRTTEILGRLKDEPSLDPEGVA